MSYHRYPAQDPEEFETFCQFVRELRPTSFLEVGSRHGCSLIRLCEAALPSLRRVEVIELPDGPWGSSGSQQDLKGCIAHLMARVENARVHWVDSCSEEAAGIVDGMQPFDLIFIDANHSLAAVRHDFGRFYPKLATGGWIAFHDINGRASFQSKGRRMGVPTFWKEIVESGCYETREIVNPAKSYGIGLVRAAPLT